MQAHHYLNLFIAIITLAVIPGPCVLAIVSRAMSHGFGAAALMTLGVALADVVFILLAVLGLSALASMLGSAFVVIQYCSAAYLIYLGVGLIYASLKMQHGVASIKRKQECQHQRDEDKPSTSSVKANKPTTHLLTGLAIAMSNPKAIVFYVSFFPAFVPVTQLGYMDILGLMLLSIAGFGGTNLCYAALGASAQKLLTSAKAVKIMQLVSGIIMLCAGFAISFVISQTAL
ncbi:LysE family translocator [Shewanella maritima]|uniref:LysE family translocator n=1 Tax=Shewanella maritima TaxID=2520507 RepID=A0A411PL12_9GAMM|nr:LysE family translocator [Shewanella maritima]QBF84233.1 LysE family translocator [Shewanella maritima]